MRNAVLAVALATVINSSLALSQTPAVTNAQPGILASFLKGTKNPSMRNEPLGKLAGGGPAEAMFEAVVAWDPAFPDVRVKGLRVLLSEGVRREIIYLDADHDEELDRDSLKEFQSDLAHLIADRDSVFKGRPTGTFVGASVLNRTSPERYIPRTNVFDAGWYSSGKRFGVVMDSRWVGPGWFYFPAGDLAQLVEIIERGREFLQTH